MLGLVRPGESCACDIGGIWLITRGSLITMYAVDRKNEFDLSPIINTKEWRMGG